MKGKKNHRYSSAPVYDTADWIWIIWYAFKVVALTSIGLCLEVFLIYLCARYGLYWSVPYSMIIIGIGFFSFCIPYSFIWRMFRISDKTHNRDIANCICIFIAILMVLCDLAVFAYSNGRFVPRLKTDRFSQELNLDNIGMIDVKKMEVDTARGMGLVFESRTVPQRNKTEIVYYCYAVFPIKDRKSDYYGVRVEESHRYFIVKDEKALNEYWKQFRQASLEKVDYNLQFGKKSLVRVPDDMHLEGYREALRERYGEGAADGGFRVWEEQKNSLKKFSKPLVYLGWGMGALFLLVFLYLLISGVKKNDILSQEPFGTWFLQKLRKADLPSLIPVFCVIVYGMIARFNGMGLEFGNDNDMILMGAPTLELVRQGQWWRLITGAFFPYDYSIIVLVGLSYVFSIPNSRIRIHPVYIFAVYFAGALTECLCEMYGNEPDIVSVASFGGLLGLYSCYICLALSRWRNIKKALSASGAIAYFFFIFLVCMALEPRTLLSSVPVMIVGALSGLVLYASEKSGRDISRLL